MSRRNGKSRIFDDQAKIIRTTALGEPAKVLMLAIYWKAHNGDGECWATNATLAADTGRTGDDGSPERAVSRLVAELVREGWIVATDPDASKFSKRRRYVLGPRFGAVEPREPRQKRRASERMNHDKNVVASTTIMSPTHDKNVVTTTPRTAPRTAPCIKPPPHSATPAPHAREKADPGGGVGEVRSRFIRACIGKFGGRCSSVATEAAARHQAERLAEAMQAIQMGEARAWADVRVMLEARPALATAGAARRPPPNEDDDIPF